MKVKIIRMQLKRFIKKVVYKKRVDCVNTGILYICPTPIGNLKDITIRVLETLESVDYIYAEDTRHSIKLLNHYNIKKPLISYHKYNEISKVEEIIDKLESGNDLALISDAGMPGISDPGEIIIKELIKRNLEFRVLPGASALLNALVGSGLDTKSFIFKGFLSKNNKEYKTELKSLERENSTIIIYESPHRIKKTLNELRKYLGNINISICRELTKKYEEFIRGSIDEVLKKVEEINIKGEIVLVMEPKEEEELEISDLNIENTLKKLINDGISKKEAIKITANNLKVPKNRVYQISIDI